MSPGTKAVELHWGQKKQAFGEVIEKLNVYDELISSDITQVHQKAHYSILNAFNDSNVP